MTAKRIRIVAMMLSLLGPLIVFQPAARADVVQLHLTSAGSDVSHNIYISPYYAMIGSSAVAVPVICDDFLDDSYVGESWTATVYAGSGDLSHTRMALLSSFTGATLDRSYDAVDYLARQLPGANATDRTLISFAIWDIFASSDVSARVNDSAFYSAVHDKQQDALLHAPTNARFDLTIYSSPITNVTGGGSTPPQEFVRTPEASAPFVLAFDLLALLGAGLFVRRHVLLK